MHLYSVVFPTKVAFMISVLAYAEILLFVTVCFSSYLTPAMVTDSASLKVNTTSAKIQVTMVGGEEMELHVMLEDALSDL